MSLDMGVVGQSIYWEFYTVEMLGKAYYKM